MRSQQMIRVAVLTAGFAFATAGAAMAAPVAHWLFDDGQSDPSTLTAVDSLAPAADGTWIEGAGGGGTIPRWVDGRFGGAADFGGDGGASGSRAGVNPGTGDVISASGSGKLGITGELSIAAWVLYEEKNGRLSTRHIAGRDMAGGATGDAYSLKHSMSGSADSLQFMVSSGGVNVNLTANDTLSNYTANSLNDGWVHVVGVFRPGNSMQLYVNGVLDIELLDTGMGEVPASIDLEPDTPFNIGRLAGSETHSFNGRIDDVRVFNHALSGAEVSQIFVPEPSAWILAGLAAVGLVAWRRKSG